MEATEIPDYDGYTVSPNGVVESRRPGRKHRILTGSTTAYGYRTVGLYGPEGRRRFPIHRLVATAFIPNPDNRPQVNHLDGDKLNNRVENLEWCTARENMLHAFRTGLIRPHRVCDKRAVVADYATGMTQQAVADKHGCTRSYVGLIVTKKLHLKGDYTMRQQYLTETNGGIS
jgi:hypothetical protein